MICIDERESNYEKIYYWFHEAPESEDLFLIAKSFFDFISKLEVREDIVDSDEGVEKVKIDKRRDYEVQFRNEQGEFN